MTKGVGGKFSLSGPCADCPFRSDKRFELRPSRVDEIADALLNDDGFTCHKTIEYDDSDGTPTITRDARECGGAMATLEKMNRPSQVMRIAERLGMYERHQIDPDAPVYDSINEWRHAMKLKR
jgi:hypothetical protein